MSAVAAGQATVDRVATDDLRVAVVGAGSMGSDHIRRIGTVISGARVVSVVEPDASRAAAAAQHAPGATSRTRIEDAIDQDDLDAVVIATPGPFHEAVLLPALEAGLSILCEKPLTPDSQSSMRIVDAEAARGRKQIQVGFMRRFDAEYLQLRQLIESRDAGNLLMLHCAHRNPSVPESYVDSMLITDSAVHEIDIVPWLVGEPIAAVEVKRPKRNSLAPARLNEPQFILLQTGSGVLADVEMSVSLQFGYQVTTQAVFEQGVAEIGRTGGLSLWHNGRYGGAEHASYITRFGAAYDHEVQRWVDAARSGTVDGPSAWDGYLAARVCEAALEAQSSGARVEVSYAEQPALYR